MWALNIVIDSTNVIIQFANTERSCSHAMPKGEYLSNTFVPGLTVSFVTLPRVLRRRASTLQSHTGCKSPYHTISLPLTHQSLTCYVKKLASLQGLTVLLDSVALSWISLRRPSLREYPFPYHSTGRDSAPRSQDANPYWPQQTLRTSVDDEPQARRAHRRSLVHPQTSPQMGHSYFDHPRMLDRFLRTTARSISGTLASVASCGQHLQPAPWFRR